MNLQLDAPSGAIEFEGLVSLEPAQAQIAAAGPVAEARVFLAGDPNLLTTRGGTGELLEA
jgi:hypothetical protein